jgi:hypothetical protein
VPTVLRKLLHCRRNGVNSGESIQVWTSFEAENVRGVLTSCIALAFQNGIFGNVVEQTPPKIIFFQLIPLRIFSTDTALHIEVQHVVIAHGGSSSWLEPSK